MKPYLQAAIDAEVRRLARELQAEARRAAPRSRWPRFGGKRTGQPLRVASERVDRPRPIEP